MEALCFQDSNTIEEKNISNEEKNSIYKKMQNLDDKIREVMHLRIIGGKMFLKEELEKIDGRIKLFVDMDGVIADYNVGKACEYDRKRPLYDSIKKLEEISKMPNVEMFILSITRMTEGCEQKHKWLDKYASLFIKKNRVIISREDNNFVNSDVLKTNFLRDLERDGSTIILIDDDPSILYKVKQNVQDVLLYKDTVLVD